MTRDDGEMVWRGDAVEEVRDLRREALAAQDTETVGLDRIGGRVLAAGITAPRDVPSFDFATMDGYAFDATQAYPLALIEDAIYPEDDPPSLDAGEAVEIATGAPLPDEANVVLKREDATVTDGELSGDSIEPGTYTYERGTNVEAGEGLFEAGERLSAKDAILLRDLDVETLEARAPFEVGILATGSEIHEGRTRDLDSPMLAALVRSWGHEPTYEGTVPDEYDRVRARIEELAERYDVVLTTGGTSVGHKDYVVRALRDLGNVHFHGVRIRPGKPIAAATLPEATVFAIPGKPVGAHVITTLVCRPFFAGETDLPTVPKTLPVDVGLGREGFEYVVPVTVDGETATPLGHVSSPLSVYEETFDPSVLSSATRATRADGFVVTETALAAGDTVDVVPYSVVE